jgi:hypothetical protein
MPYPYYQSPWSYNPSYATPSFSPQYQLSMPTNQQTPVHGFIYVNGIEGARAFQMPPNSEMPLFDSNGTDRVFIKTTDGAGYPTITVAKCIKEDDNADPKAYVTRDELERVYKDFASQVEALKGAMNGTVPATADATQPDAGQPQVNQADGWRQPTGAVSPAYENQPTVRSIHFPEPGQVS